MKVQGQTCSYREFTVESKGEKYIVVLAVLADEEVKLKDVEVEQISVNTLIDEVLKLQTV